MRIANNVEMLEITSGQGTLYPVLIWDDSDVILIDTGLPGQLELIRAAVKKAGFSIEQITKVILTHHDMDHVGCAKLLSELGIEMMAHEQEAPYIQGDEPSPKLVNMEKHINELSEGERAFYERIKAGAPNFYVHVDRLLRDGEMLPFCGGIEVIHTPGHTPGHISLLLRESNILVTGDAANILEGVLTDANPDHTLDIQEAEKSFEKMKSHISGLVICYHGGRSE